MNTGQTLITLGALMFLTSAVLDLNRFIADNDISMTQNQYRMEALSLLNAYIKEASAQYFDEASTDPDADKRVADFIAPEYLGLDGNDNGNIDDFDDYHSLTVNDTGMSGVPYQLNFEIDYVNLPADQITTSGSREYHKRMKISIHDNYAQPLIYKWVNGLKVKDTLSVSYVKSYWFYN